VLRDPDFKGHEKVRLSREEFDRVITWVDLNGVYYPTYECAYPGSRTGRSPIDRAELGNLQRLTGVAIDRMMSHGGYRDPQVNFTRPELSGCLSRLPKEDPRRAEALTIIRTGAERLKENPRADMPGFIPCETDQCREAFYAERHQVEQKVREAIRRAEKVYD